MSTIPTTATPTRIQLSRRKGWRLPANTVMVSRPSKWGNPFVVNKYLPPHEAVRAYRLWLRWDPIGRLTGLHAKNELRGKDLACWCKHGAPCHADVLLKVANQ